MNHLAFLGQKKHELGKPGSWVLFVLRHRLSYKAFQ